jgi:hypothetical protein
MCLTAGEALGSSRGGARRRAVRDLARDQADLLSIILAAIAAIAIQSLWIPLDADVSWLITVCERVLDGDRLYVGVLEVNPPASVWLYMPLVWLARMIGAKPEALIAAGFVAGAIGSLAATRKLVFRLQPASPWLTPAAAFCALVLPMGLFAQREHAALLLALPALTVVALIGEGQSLRRGTVIGAGVAAGLIVVLKPYFLFAMLLPALWAVRRRGSILPLVPGLVAAICAVLAYGLAAILIEGAYFHWLPMLSRTYLRMHDDGWRLLTGGIVLFPALCAMLAGILRPPRIPPLAASWGLGALGFAVAGLLQAKNYPNHWLAGAVLADLAVVVLLLGRGVERGRRRLGLVALAAIVAVQLWKTASVQPDPEVAAAIHRLAPPAPTILALSSNLDTGHPVTRNIGGRWVGSRAALYTAAGARFTGLRTADAKADYRMDLRSFANDLDRHKPDVVLVNASDKTWLMREPVIAQAMRNYAPAARAGDSEVWLRR